MTIALAALTVALLAVLALHALAARSWAAERRSLLRLVVARHAGDAAALTLADRPRRRRKATEAKDPDVPPPGTQPIGLGG